MRGVRGRGFRAEYFVVDRLGRAGFVVYRVPMSNMPFDVLAVHGGLGVVYFVEVKGGGGGLSVRQRRFAELIGGRDDWVVRYVVAVVDVDRGSMFMYEYGGE